MQQVLTPLSKGLNARIELEKKTEKLSLFERHRRKIDELTVECKQVSMSGRERLCFIDELDLLTCIVIILFIKAREKFLKKNTEAKEDIAQECYDYMSTSAGRKKVLNPPDRTPIADINWGTTDFEK